MSIVAFEGTITDSNGGGMTYEEYKRWVAARAQPDYYLSYLADASFSLNLLRGVAGFIAEFGEFIYEVYISEELIEVNSSSELTEKLLSEACDVYFWLTYLDYVLGINNGSMAELPPKTSEFYAQLVGLAEKVTRTKRDECIARKEALREMLEAFVTQLVLRTGFPFSKQQMAQHNYDKLTARRPDLTVSA